jgi:hypothetical protein
MDMNAIIKKLAVRKSDMAQQQHTSNLQQHQHNLLGGVPSTSTHNGGGTFDH